MDSLKLFNLIKEIKRNNQESLKVGCFGENGQGKTHLACGLFFLRPQPTIVIDAANTISKKNVLNYVDHEFFENTESIKDYLLNNNNAFIDCSKTLILRGLAGSTLDEQKKDLEGFFEFLYDFLKKLDRKDVNFKKTIFFDEADAFLGKHSAGAFPLVAKQARNYDTDIFVSLKAPQDICNAFLRELDFTFFYNLEHKGDLEYLKNRCAYPDEFIQKLPNLQKHEFCCYYRKEKQVITGYMPENLLKYI